jgi:DNA replication protein DnaC
VLEAEVDERERNVVAHRLKEARLPKVKTLEDFDFTMAPQVSASVIRALGTGDWIGRAEPIMLLGDAGTGKTHLAIALAVIACRQWKRVRFTTAAELVNDLMEAHHQHESSRVLARWIQLGRASAGFGCWNG